MPPGSTASVRRWTARGYDRLVVYADREHSANLAWLTGFDPRFEEAVAVVGPSDEPAILVGNECYGTAGAAPLPMRRVLYQDLSLPGQPRDRSRPLAEILAGEGIGPGRRVGVVGWKTYPDRATMETPAFLVDELRRLTGPSGLVENATDLLIDAGDGLRVTNEVEQLAALEYAACQTSSGVRRVLTGLRPGMTEREAVRLLDWNGMPLSCHLMLTAGPRARFGLLSPATARSSAAIRSPSRSACGARSTAGRASWSRTRPSCRPRSRITWSASSRPISRRSPRGTRGCASGRPAARCTTRSSRRLADPFFGIFLNPGHQIGLDEWVNSPFAAGSTIELRSGMAFQADVIPATGTDYFTTNIEDGVALADGSLRAAFAAAYPAAWARIEARRRFMRESLGIELHDDVLPLSNLAAHLPPFVLRPDRAMTLAG